MTEGFDMFCERCGTRHAAHPTGQGAAETALARRAMGVLRRAGVISEAAPPPPPDPGLRLCLGCRGYTCAACWNDGVGVCQTCVPVPEPIAALPPAPEPVPEPELEPVVLAQPEPEPELEPVVLAQPEPEPQPESEPEAAPSPPTTVPAFVRPRGPLPSSEQLPPPPPAPVFVPQPPRQLPRPSPLIAFDTTPPAPWISGPSSYPHNVALPPAPVPPGAYSAPQHTARSCSSCRLPISSSARFCRRCGSAQS